MTLVNVVLVVLVSEFAGIFFSFPSMIENARRAARDTQRGHFRPLIEDHHFEQVLDLVDTHFNHHSVAFLRTARAFLVALVVTSFTAWLAAYYLATRSIPDLLTKLAVACLRPDHVQLVDASLNNIPTILYLCAGGLEFLILLVLAGTALAYDLPRTVWQVMNPPRRGQRQG